ncbi:MAG: cytochrome C oxidase subunit IV family protein [Gemmatimonadota bacterium]|nr:cytochrome C oxidase subunit IV family protein [Gemmatimonadota bacterium]
MDQHATGSGAGPERDGQPHAEHASVRTYVGVAAILAVITAVEVMVFYIEALHPVLVPILLTLSAAKFVLVVGFFMHLKYDDRIFRGIFLGPLFVAVAVILAMLALYGVFTGGGAA